MERKEYREDAAPPAGVGAPPAAQVRGDWMPGSAGFLGPTDDVVSNGAAHRGNTGAEPTLAPGERMQAVSRLGSLAHYADYGAQPRPGDVQAGSFPPVGPAW